MRIGELESRDASTGPTFDYLIDKLSPPEVD
jgi:hypothetical protein